MPRSRMNDEERRLWVLNDEGLYSWWKSERLPLQKFIKEHREEIDAAIDMVMNPQPSWQSQHRW